MKNLDLILDLLAYNGSPTNDPADSIRAKNLVQETEIASINRSDLLISNGTTDQVIALPAASIDYLIILTDRDISIKLNGWATPLQLKPRAAGVKTWAFFTKGAVTGLTVSNASGAAANVDVIAANK